MNSKTILILFIVFTCITLFSSTDSNQKADNTNKDNYQFNFRGVNWDTPYGEALKILGIKSSNNQAIKINWIIEKYDTLLSDTRYIHLYYSNKKATSIYIRGYGRKDNPVKKIKTFIYKQNLLEKKYGNPTKFLSFNKKGEQYIDIKHRFIYLQSEVLCIKSFWRLPDGTCIKHKVGCNFREDNIYYYSPSECISQKVEEKLHIF